MSSRDDWIKASTLAPVLGYRDTKSVHRRAAQEGWRCEERVTRGGTALHYHVASLPTDLQQKLRAHEEGRQALAGDLVQEASEKSLSGAHGLSARAQRRLDAKLALLRMVEEMARGQRLTISAAEKRFAEAYNSRQTNEEPSVREAVPSVSSDSLGKWRRAARGEGGFLSLADRYKSRKGRSKIVRQKEIEELCIGMLHDKPHSKATHLHMAVQARFRDRAEIEIPSVRAIERWLKAWKIENAEVFTHLTSPDKWRNKYLVAVGSASAGVERPNQLWESDGTPGDVMLTDGRHQVLGTIDVCTRRLKLLVVRTPKAVAVAALRRRCILDWGVPEAEKTDNGKEYVAEHNKRINALLNIEHKLCVPFQPQQKPHIERALRTFSHDLVELLPGYIGHNVAQRKDIEARRSFADRLMRRGEAVQITMSCKDFQAFCDDWCDSIYMRRPHEGLGGKSPFEVAASWTGPVRRVSNERALDVLLTEGDYRIVKKGAIRIDDARFIAPELGGYGNQRVFYRLDALDFDLGRVYVFDEEGRTFICVAECPERTGVDSREVAARAKAVQRQRLREGREALRACSRRAKTGGIVDEIIADQVAAARKLSILPRPGIEHASEGLSAAASAAAAADRATRPLGVEDEQRLLSGMPLRGVRGAQQQAGKVIPLRPRQSIDRPFESVFDRLYALLKERLTGELSPSDLEYLEEAKATNHATYDAALNLVREQYEGRTPRAAPQ